MDAFYGWQKEFGDSMYTFGYINGYKEAGDILVSNGCPDLLLFPIMSNYRHYLELLFKNICEKNMSKKLFKNFIYKNSHDLNQCWINAKSFLSPSLPSAQIEYIENVVSFFYNLDPHSYTFRYEKDKKLKKSIKQDHLNIDLLELKESIDTVDSFLRSTYDFI